MGIEKELSIVAQVAAKEAGAIVRTIIGAGGVWDENQFTLIAAHINEVIIDLAGGTAPAAPAAPAPMRDAAATVAAAFPGAQVVESVQTDQQQAGGFLASIGLRPHQLSTSSDERINLQAHVADLDNNPDNWYDNRFSKRNPKAPEFKNKATGVGLWVR